MLSTKEVRSWATDSHPILFVSVETKLVGRPHDRLLKDLGMPHFPSLAILDPDGKVLSRHVEPRVTSMREAVEAGTTFLRLRARRAAGKTVDRGAWFLARLTLGRLAATEARREAKETGLSAAQRKRAARLLRIVEWRELLAAWRGKTVTRVAAGDRVYRWFKAGWIPSPDSTQRRVFESLLLDGAERAKDAKAFAFAYPCVRGRMRSQLEMLRQNAKRSANRDNGFLQQMMDRTDASLKRLAERARRMGIEGSDGGR